MSNQLSTARLGASSPKDAVALARLFRLADRPMDPHMMCGINAMTLLELRRVHGKQSRSDLSRRSGLSRPSTSAQVERLIELGIVAEAGSGFAGTRDGKTPILLWLNRELSCVPAAPLRTNGIRFQRIDVDGMIEEDRFVSTRGRRGEAAITQELRNGIASLLKCSAAPLRAICLAVPGIVDSGADIVLETDNLLRWRNLELRREMRREYESPLSSKTT